MLIKSDRDVRPMRLPSRGSLHVARVHMIYHGSASVWA
jgi:hypothetical protein